MRGKAKAEMLKAETLKLDGLHEVAFGRGRIEFRLKRTGRRTLAITVRPDTSVVVTAPKGAAVEAVMARVRKRAVWIRRQQAYFSRFLPKLPPRRYVSGETHRYLGRQYRLKVVEGPGEGVKLRGGLSGWRRRGRRTAGGCGGWWRHGICCMQRRDLRGAWPSAWPGSAAA